MVFAEWQVGEVFLSMLWFTLLFLWIWTVVVVFTDIFRSRDMGGGAKAVWTLFVIFLPFVGVLVYLVARGHKIGEHELEDRRQADEAMQTYIRSAAATPVTDLGKLTELHDRGVIDDAEFESMKGRVAS